MLKLKLNLFEQHSYQNYQKGGSEEEKRRGRKMKMFKIHQPRLRDTKHFTPQNKQFLHKAKEN